MSSSNGVPRRRIGVFWVFSLLVTGLAGLLMVVGGLLPGVAAPGRVFLLSFGVFLLFIVVRWVRLYARPPAHDDAVVASVLDGEPALVMRMTSDVPVNALVATGLLAGAFWVCGVLLVVDGVGGAYLVLALALLFTWFVPDSARTVWSPSGVVVSPSTVEVRAWDATSRVSWDDVTAVEVVTHKNRLVLRVRASPTATSWQVHRRRWLKRFDPRPPDRTADIFLLAVALDDLVVIAAMSLWQRDPSARADIGTPQSVRDLLELR